MPAAADADLTALADRLRRDRRRDPYAGRADYVRTARELNRHCAELLAGGEAAMVEPAVRKAVERITTTLMYMDDSSGILGTELRHTMHLYAQACTLAPPKPAKLAAWLVGLQLDGPGWPDITLRDFADALGPDGIASIERMVEERRTTMDGESTSRYMIRDLREQLAGLTGDVDHHIAVIAEDLRGTHRYTTIATILRRAGRPDEAIDWARRGLADGVRSTYDQQLLDLLVQILHEQGDHDAALEERQADFDHRPIASTYHALINAAEQADQTAAVQPQALDQLRNRTTTDPRRAGELIKVLLDLGHTDEAWTSAKQHPDLISETLWHDLLNRRQVTHPADVLPHYRRLTEAHIADSRDKQRYRRAVTLLLRMREAATAADQRDEFDTYVNELRRTNRIRPNFVAGLDKAHL